MEIQVHPRKRRGGKRSHKGRQSAHHKFTGKYSKQRIRTERNKVLARAKHLANHPDDLQALRTLAGKV